MYLEWFFKEKAAGEKSLEEVVVDLLAERKLHVTTAESCTGGLIAAPSAISCAVCSLTAP